MHLRLIGYWRSDAHPEYPDPAASIDATWNADARDDVAQYLRTGLVARAYMGFSPCRLCDRTNNGNLELTDGVYLWPQGLAHYVTDHDVRLSKAFLAHVTVMRDRLDNAESSLTWWLDQHGR